MENKTEEAPGAKRVASMVTNARLLVTIGVRDRLDKKGIKLDDHAGQCEGIMESIQKEMATTVFTGFKASVEEQNFDLFMDAIEKAADNVAAQVN